MYLTLVEIYVQIQKKNILCHQHMHKRKKLQFFYLKRGICILMDSILRLSTLKKMIKLQNRVGVKTSTEGKPSYFLKIILASQWIIMGK